MSLVYTYRARLPDQPAFYATYYVRFTDTDTMTHRAARGNNHDELVAFVGFYHG